MNTEKQEIAIINIKNIITTLVIISLIVSLYLNNKDKEIIMGIENDEKLLDTIDQLNSFFLLVLTIISLIIIIWKCNIDEVKDNSEKVQYICDLVTLAAILSVVISIILFYVSTINSKDTDVNTGIFP